MGYSSVKEVDFKIRNLQFHNLTPPNTPIPRGLKALLGLSPKFCPTPPRTPQQTYVSSMKPLLRSIRLSYMFRNQSSNSTYNKLIYVPNPTFQPTPAPMDVEQKMKSIEGKLLSQSIPKHPQMKFNLPKRRRQLLKEMCMNNNLKIVNTDKNLGPAIMTMDQYTDFCLNHLQQPEVYQKIHKIPLSAIKKRVIAFHTKLISDFPNEKKNAKIIIHQIEDTNNSYFHGLPKIHKKPMGCRPIVSCVSSPTTGLSKWLTFKLLPYAQKLQSYLRDSQYLQRTLQKLPVNPDGQMYTFDIQQLYTSIPISEAMTAISWFIRNDPQRNVILQGMKLVMSFNFFSFGDTYWKQKQGLAMGTPVAPILANLYLGYYEETVIIPMFQQHLFLYKRFLDDIFIIWNDLKHSPYAFNKFRAVLKRIPGMKWTYAYHPKEANFLDLWIFPDDTQYGTRTHQKKLNLYLYPTFNSAHPPGVQHGLIYGLLLKYRQQNSHDKDFKTIARLFYQRLLARGYQSRTLKPLFVKALEKVQNEVKLSNKRPRSERQNLLKIPYDPNGPSRQQLRKFLELDELANILDRHELGRITICYTRPKNLANLIMKTRLPPGTSNSSL